MKLNNQIENLNAMQQVSDDIESDMKVVVLCNIVEILLEHAPEKAKERVSELLEGWK